MTLLIVKNERKQDCLFFRLITAFSQKEMRRACPAGMDKTDGFKLQSILLRSLKKIISSFGRIDKIGPSLALEQLSSFFYNIKNIAFELMLGNGFFKRRAEISLSFSDIRRVGKDDVEFFSRLIAAQVSADNRDLLLEAIELQISAGHISQRFLDFKGRNLLERLDAQEHRDYGIPCSKLQDFIRSSGLDKVSQKRGIDSEAIALFLLKDEDPAMIKGIKCFILGLQLLTLLHL